MPPHPGLGTRDVVVPTIPGVHTPGYTLPPHPGLRACDVVVPTIPGVDTPGYTLPPRPGLRTCDPVDSLSRLIGSVIVFLDSSLSSRSHFMVRRARRLSVKLRRR
jgi:hypothetical protein